MSSLLETAQAYYAQFILSPLSAIVCLEAHLIITDFGCGSCPSIVWVIYTSCTEYGVDHW